MASSLHLVFCGTPRFAVPTLERLVEAGFQVNLVVTQPDRPRGRGMELTASPVKQRALEFGLPVTQPEKIKENDEFRTRLAAIKPDAIVVVGYGRLIPQWMLDLPPLGNINLHASLLPKYRGAAPIQWAIARGETETGVTTMLLNAGLDTGDILLQKALSIAADDTAESLSPRLADIGSELTVETLRGLHAGTIHPRPQNHALATPAPILKKEDGRIDFHRPAPEIYNRLRGFQPWPGAFTVFRGRTLNVWAARPVPDITGERAFIVDGSRLIVGCGSGTALELIEVQPEGKKRMATSDFVHGYRPSSSDRLGS